MVFLNIKGKFGETPTRSRHCNEEKLFNPLCTNGKVIVFYESEPGDLPLNESFLPTRMGWMHEEGSFYICIKASFYLELGREMFYFL
jgi:hypothetical protein